MTNIDTRIDYLYSLLVGCYYAEYAKPWRDEVERLEQRRAELIK